MENINRGVRKGTWSREEDSLLRQCMDKYGEGKWHLVPIRAGLNRCRKSCRLRWLNYLRPNINRSCFTKDEVDLMIRLHKLLGNKWTLIAGRLPRRTANDVKNFWTTHIEKKLASATQREITHKTITQINIVRPRPRTFLKPVQIQLPKTDILTKTQTIEQDKKPCGSQKAPFSASTSQKEVDECIQWWKNLLETTENGELPNFLSEENGHNLVQNNDKDGSTTNVSLEFDDDEDVTNEWELFNII